MVSLPRRFRFRSLALAGLVLSALTRAGDNLYGQASIGSQGERRSRLSYGWHAQDGSDAALSASRYRRRGELLAAQVLQQ